MEEATSVDGLSVPVQVFAGRWRGNPDRLRLHEGALLRWFTPDELDRLRLHPATRDLIRRHAANNLGFDGGLGVPCAETLSEGGRVVAHSNNGGKPISLFHWFEDGEVVDGKAAVLALAERLTGIRVTEFLLEDATYESEQPAEEWTSLVIDITDAHGKRLYKEWTYEEIAAASDRARAEANAPVVITHNEPLAQDRSEHETGEQRTDAWRMPRGTRRPLRGNIAAGPHQPRGAEPGARQGDGGRCAGGCLGYARRARPQAAVGHVVSRGGDGGGAAGVVIRD